MKFKFESEPFHQAQDFIELFNLLPLKDNKKIGFVEFESKDNTLVYENLRPIINIEGKDTRVDRGYVIRKDILKVINDIGLKNITRMYYIPRTDKKKIRIEYSNYEKGW